VTSVSVNQPKTPITKGSNGIAAATIPNVCKMPGPPAPFVPTPLPNIGRSGLSPDGYTTTVKVEGNTVCIAGSTFKSMGDIASQGTGGGIISNNVEGPTKPIAPGSLDTKFEGKRVQLLGDQTLNNCGPTGTPANAACMMGTAQAPNVVMPWGDNPMEIDCKKLPKNAAPNNKFDKCEKEEVCAKTKAHNENGPVKRVDTVSASYIAKRHTIGPKAQAAFRADGGAALAAGATPASMKPKFLAECRHSEWAGKNPVDPTFHAPTPLEADHVVELQFGGAPGSENLKWTSKRVNGTMGSNLKNFEEGQTGLKPVNCDCDGPGT
jgi:hypothetical protein